MNTAITAGGIFSKKCGDKYHLLLRKYPESGNLAFLKGHIEAGETIEQTAIREVREETGLKNIKIIKKIGKLIRQSTSKMAFKEEAKFLKKYKKEILDCGQNDTKKTQTS